MLSILIPTYNYNVFPLVEDLHNMAVKENIAFEIIVMDDGSTDAISLKENEKINTLSNSRFMQLPQNVGLAENRNTLAWEAQYENLLFIDGDGLIINPDYLKNYIENLADVDIVYGGRKHPENVAAKKQKLRWKYGLFIEDTTAEQRKTAVYQKLLFNNTLLKKQCFDKVTFDPELRKYGHEDTLFAYKVSLLQLRVKHIDNAVEHGDVDHSDVFLRKTKMGLVNIKNLYLQHKIDPDFVKMLRIYKKLTKIGLKFPIGVFYFLFEKPMHKNLTSGKPSLFLFNLYRLSYICSLK
jgi:glycosyltransferase involved in cell wall biosynthesis